MIKTVLLVLFILDGEAHTFAVQTESQTECIVMQSKAGAILFQLLRRPPEFFAASCAEVTPYLVAS